MGAVEGGEGGGGTHFGEDGGDEGFQRGALGVVGGHEEIYAFVGEQFASFFGVRGGGIVHADGGAAAVFHDAHGGDVRLAVPDVDHVGEGDAPVRLSHKLVDGVLIAEVAAPLAYPEKVLCFGGVIDHLTGPIGLARLVVEEG